MGYLLQNGQILEEEDLSDPDIIVSLVFFCFFFFIKNYSFQLTVKQACHVSHFISKHSFNIERCEYL